MKSSNIGGQAVLEGIMMKNGDRYAVAVRLPDQKIEVKEETYKPVFSGDFYRKTPFVRGVFAFIDSLVLGISTLTYSASFFEEEEEMERKAKLSDEEKAKASKKEKAVMSGTVVVSFIFAIAVFVLIPYYLSQFFQKFIDSSWLIALIEGILRLAIFIGYVAAISLMKDIRRTYMYHGAEHKCINCVEHGLPLTVENVRKSSKEHKRCGTSFLLFVVLISILLFMFIQTTSPLLRVLLRLLLIPVIAGIAYELLKLAGNSDGKLINAISRPGLWVQGLTTREPDDSMIEVAIAATEQVFDWKKYLEENFDEGGNPL